MQIKNLINKWLEKDIDYLKLLITLTIPIALQNLVSTSLNFVDSIMIGKLGEINISGVGLANQIFFLLILMIFGICNGSGIFIAQYWGSKDNANIKRAVSVMALTALTIGILFTAITILFPEKITGIFTDSNNPQSALIIDTSVKYIRIVALSYIPTVISSILSTSLRCIEKPKIPLIISIVAIFTNIIFNYLLIFGKFGFPELGAEGAAIATVIARVLEAACFIFYTYFKCKTIAIFPKDLKTLNLPFIKKIFKFTLPVFLNESLWALGVTIYSVIYGHMSNPAMILSVMNIQKVIEQLTNIITFSIANSCGIIIGKKIGEDREDIAFSFAKKTIYYVLIIASVCVVFVSIFTKPLINQFNVTNEVKEQAFIIVLIYMLYIPFRASNCVNVVGILRSGGDTVFCSILDICGVWLIGLPNCFIAGILLKLDLPFVVALTLSEELIKFVITTKRIYSGKWINNLTEVSSRIS